MRDRVIGVDIGSHGARAVILNLRRDHIPARAEFTTAPPARRHPAEWWRAFVASVRTLPADERRHADAIAVTGVRGAVAGFDASGEAVTPGYPDFDAEAIAPARELDTFAGGDFLARTGCPAFPLAGLPKMLLHRADPAVRWWGGPQDFVLWNLLGRKVLSAGTALRMGVLTFDATAIDAQLLRAAGLDPACLPNLIPVGAVAGTLQPDVADQLGLQAGIPVVAAPGDVPAALVAAGPHAGRVLVNLGTTIVATTALAENRSCGLTREVLPEGARSAETGSGSGAATIDWLAKMLGTEPSAIDELALGAGPLGPLRFDTVLLDVWGEGRGGAISGITVASDRSELAAAALDGVARAALGAIQELESVVGRLDTVLLTGGLCASKYLVGRMKTLCELEIQSIVGRELAAEGAALTAGNSIGMSFAELP